MKCLRLFLLLFAWAIGFSGEFGSQAEVAIEVDAVMTARVGASDGGVEAVYTAQIGSGAIYA
jgi:hypothetical protein